MPSHIFLSQEFVRWEYKTLTAPLGIAFVNLGSITDFPAKKLIISSTVNQDVILSFSTPSSDQLRICIGSVTPQTMIVDLRGDNASLPALTQIMARASIAAATGTLSITLVG